MYNLIWTILLLAGFANGDTGNVFKIVNGEDADISEVPYLVSCQEPLGNHIGGGGIISQKWVLTVTHLFAKFTDSGYIVAGITEISDTETDGAVHEVEFHLIHPKYKYYRDFLAYDMALIKVKTPFEYNERVAPMVLPTESVPLDVKCTLAGWGKTSEYGGFSNHLQKAEMPYVSDPITCEEMYKDDNPERYFSDPNRCIFCIGQHDQLMCHGDSGSPLICDGVAYGLASASLICRQILISTRSVYTDINALKDFIYERADFD